VFCDTVFSRDFLRYFVKLALAGTVVFFTGCGQDQPNPNVSTYLGDPARTHFSGLDKINRSNVASLEVAWVYDTNDYADGVSTMYTSPLVVDGVLFGLSPTLNAFAVNAATGQELWRHTEEATGAIQRGLMWWRDDDNTRLFYTNGPHLVALDPATGTVIAEFAESGRLDLRPYHNDKPVSVPTPGVVVDDLLILGLGSPGDDAQTGLIVAVRAIDGEVVWQFRTIEREDETGAAAGAAGMALDAERNLVFVPTGPAMPAYFGGSRPGDNLYSNSLLALDARTGALRWHYQITRHGLAGPDLASPPTLVQVERDGNLVDAIALPTRLGQLFLFDRDTGDLLYDSTELQAPHSTIRGEQTAPTQTASSVAFTRQTFSVTERHESATSTVQTLVDSLDQGPYAPPSLNGALLFPGFNGGAGWGGAAYQPDARKLILNTQETASVLQLLEIPAGFSDQDEFLKNCARCHGAGRTGLFKDRPDRYGAGGPSLANIGKRFSAKEIDTTIRKGRGSMPAFSELGEIQRRAIIRHLFAETVDLAQSNRTTEVTYMLASPITIRDSESLPGNLGPWGTLAAVDLDTGMIDWQVPLGNYISHPGLGLGAENSGGPLLTASGLVFIAATPDTKISAYDAANGTLLWQSDLDAAGYATPVSYAVDGKQYVVIAAGGGLLGPPSGSTYMAFSLPEE
jgi:quinoprotein glucose dehydrogenase